LGDADVEVHGPKQFTGPRSEGHQGTGAAYDELEASGHATDLANSHGQISDAELTMRLGHGLDKTGFPGAAGA
jgi:hypothetical protein